MTITVEVTLSEEFIRRYLSNEDTVEEQEAEVGRRILKEAAMQLPPKVDEPDVVVKAKPLPALPRTGDPYPWPKPWNGDTFVKD